MPRAVVRRVGTAGPAAPEASARLAESGVAVLDTTDTMILIEGEPAAIEQAAAGLDGWQTLEIRSVDRPRPVRPRSPAKR